MKIRYSIFFLLLQIFTFRAMAQEGLRPLNGNLNYIYKDLASPKSKQNIGQHNKAKVNI